LLAPLEQPLPAASLPPWLLPHQAEAALRALAIMDRFGGALLADGVGLGKTYVALALALAARERAGGGETLVVAPAALRREWQRTAAQVGVAVRILSHTALARHPPTSADAVTLVVVDEAHSFRNPRTRRYDGLARLAAGRRVLLLTATPVNNSAADLAALVDLFAGANDFRLLGVADIQTALRAREGESAALVLAALTVSRTRRLVESRFPALRGAFPRRKLLAPVRYDLDAAYGGRLQAILEAVGELEGDPSAAERGAPLMALGLLRRLESGRAAFRNTLVRHRDFLLSRSAAREAGAVLTRPVFRATVGGTRSAAQTALWGLLLPPAGGLVAPAEQGWLLAIERLLALSAGAPEADAKLDALEDLLKGPLLDAKAIVFTEFRDTALAIARRLRGRFRVLCVEGTAAWAGTERLPRREALDAFAPRARGAAPDPRLEAQVLIATDVASEGMNLQDASAVVNFDLPWNPVRVMQRVGRIDRLESPHPVVSVAHVIPGRGFHDLTGVLRKLRAKLEVLPSAASPEPDPLQALWWLDAAGPLPAALERESWRRVEPFEARERWRDALQISPDISEPCVAAGVAADDLPPAAGLLLALEWPGGQRIPLPFVLAPGGGCRCDPGALGALAERAVTATPLCASASDFATVLAAALPEARRRVAESCAAQHASRPRGPGRSAALRLVAQASRSAARDRDLPRLEALSALSEALSCEVPAGLDRTILDLCRRGDLERLTDLLQKALHRRPGSASAPTHAGTARLRFVAGLAIASRCPGDVAGGASAPQPASVSEGDP
jgi:superfamily II DNA or RNA helicase